MKLTKKQQQFIIEATTNSDVCSEWRLSIKLMFPKLFIKETELVVGKMEKGKWYMSLTKYKSIISDYFPYGLNCELLRR